MKACGLTSLPDRSTFDRRLSTISADIKERIATMAILFVRDFYIDLLYNRQQTSKSNKTHARELIKQKIDLGIET
jgi:hypothetical protein